MRGETARKSQEKLGDPEFGPWLAQASILVVDDEPGMRNFLVRTLGPLCKRIEEAADTEEASRKLDANYFDVVILDNIMPGRHGVDWLAEQRAIGFFADAILMTAFADLETAIRALQAGAVDFVLKPFRSNQILNAVAQVPAAEPAAARKLRAALRTALELGSYPAARPVDRRIRGDPTGARDAGPGRAIADVGAADRPVRHRQGSGGAVDSLAVGSSRQAFRAGELRGYST